MQQFHVKLLRDLFQDITTIVNRSLLLFPPANWRNFVGNVSYYATLSGKAGEKFCLCNFEYEMSTCVRDFKNSHFCKGGRERHSRRRIVV